MAHSAIIVSDWPVYKKKFHWKYWANWNQPLQFIRSSTKINSFQFDRKKNMTASQFLFLIVLPVLVETYWHCIVLFVSDKNLFVPLLLYLKWEFLKIYMLDYYHMQVILSLHYFDWTNFDRVIALFHLKYFIKSLYMHFVLYINVN